MRAAAVWTVLAFVLMSSAAAQAQLPIPIPANNQAGVEIKAATTHLTVSLDHAATVEVIVTNTGSPTGTPIDQPRTVTLVVDGIPPEWSVGISPANFRLGPGQSGKATLTAAVTATSNHTAVLTVTAHLFGLGVSAVPVAGSQIDPEAAASTQVTIDRSDSATRVFIENVGPYLWALVLALVAAVVVIISLIAANRRVAVRLSATESEQTVSPGTRAVFPMTVHNITRRPDTIVISTSPMPEGWAAFLPALQVDLEPGQQEEISVVVIAPRDAKEGDRQAVLVTATSAQAPRRPANVSFTAIVGPAVKRKKGEEPIAS